MHKYKWVSKRSFLAFGVVLLGLGLTFDSWAEPWLSNRFAQNCASCHSPARKNKTFSERRCTLSCQGCHVNPNGGGIRNLYGQWNQQRWLRSFLVDNYPFNKRKPKPFKEQLAANEKAFLRKNKKATGFPLRLSRKDDVDEKDYDRSDNEWQKEAKDEDEFLRNVTSGDPYREEPRTPILGTFDFRYMGYQDLQNSSDFLLWPMATDVGIRIRPTARYLQLVGEARFLNGPTKPGFEEIFLNSSQVKSAYFLVDSLPYNSYLMYGIYRPMFGNFDPNHTTLSNTITGLGQTTILKSLGVGTAPNVPFFNFNLVTPFSTASPQSEGFVANLGARWVTLGASAMVSFWQTDTLSGNSLLNTQLIGFTGGMQLWRVTTNAEFVLVSREFTEGNAVNNNVFTLQTKTRYWRENYFVLNYALSTSSRSFANGSANELTVGFKSFLISGLEFETLYVNGKDINNDSQIETPYSSLQLQLHLFI